MQQQAMTGLVKMLHDTQECIGWSATPLINNFFQCHIYKGIQNQNYKCIYMNPRIPFNSRSLVLI